ncbi:MAG TPA: sigma-70 family RNA polymerase sigma factor [Terriglobia bacterium]|nr:sigma-70 family RNA polymerase sigma factor [Terriglobia bacterium]
MGMKRLELTAAERNDAGKRERGLVLAAQRGDSTAFRALYEDYRDRVYSLAIYSTGDDSQAQDLVQVVFLSVFRGLKSFRFQSSFSTWVYRIAHNECQNYHRRRRANVVPLEVILGGIEEIDPKPISDAQHARQECQSIVQQAVMQLPFQMREAVVLRYVEGLSYEEIAKVLGCAPGTVASRLSRALAELEERVRPFRRFL